MIKGLTGRGCNRHRGRIKCDVALRGRTSWNVITGSPETFTGQTCMRRGDELCQQITRAEAKKTNELRQLLKLWG